jgi:signal transduction histidine kinase/CheY-like chemotaxis protein
MIQFFVFFVFICSTGVALANDPEFGHPLFRTFTAHDYGELGQIFAITEDPQGRMLFGAANALLAFDNSRWQKIPAPGTGFIRSLAVDSRGFVWFSSPTQIGYLSRVDGEDQIVKVSEGWFGGDCRILVNGSQIYIIGEGGFFLCNNGKISEVPCPADLRHRFCTGVVHGKIWVADRNGCIYELDEGRFNKIAGSPSNAGDVQAMVDCPIDDGLIVRASGIFRKAGGTLIPWKTDIDPLLARSAAFSAQWIMGKFLAVLVQDSGVYLLDRQGHLVEDLTVDSGLADAGFESLGEDREGGLWVGTDTEITRVQCGSGYSEFDHELGLPKGFVADVARYQGKIYTATQHGVYVLRPAEDVSKSALFFRLGERDDRFFGLTVDGSTAFAISEMGAYILDPANSRLERIGSGGVMIVPSAIDRNRLFLSTRHGLESIRNDNGRWYSEGLLSQLPSSIPAIAEDEQGDLFLWTGNGDFYRVELGKGAQPLFRNARIERLPDLQNRKVPSGDGPICQWQGQVLLIGDDLVWKLSPDNSGVQPFDLIARSLPGRNVDLMMPSRITEDYVWVGSRPLNSGPETGFEVGRLYSSGRYEALSHAISYPLGIINCIWDENVDGRPVAWIAGDYGLMRVFLDQPTFNQRKFELYPTQITTADGTPIPWQDGAELSLTYDDRDFRIRFGTGHFSVGGELYYETILEGRVVHQSPITTTPVWRSGALNEGHYLLLVQARDSNGVESKNFRLAFIIQPPWYRNLWTEIGSGVLVILVIYLFLRWRTWQMKMRERKLVQLVDLRTRELREHEVELRNAKDAAEIAKEAAELARENAETANRAKTAFLANMSHELRTPINSILGYAQILLRRTDCGGDATAKLKTILSSGEHLLEMINEVLDLSRVESGKVSIALRPLELPKFIGSIVDEFELRASRSNLTFVYQVQGDLPEWIETDPPRLRQVFYNLLGNAMKFTVQGEVGLRVYVTSDLLRFEVKDTGRGIPCEDLASIFKPFHQAANNQLIGQGVGLGLHISKQIVDLLGGKISFVSEPDCGSTFTFEIPRRDAEPVSPEVTSPQVIGYEGRRRKILIVDDEALNRSFLRELLAIVGFESVEASSAEEASSLLNDSFDAVISDIRMPGYDGHTFCQSLRLSAETRGLVVIASSASVFADDQRLARASGFTDFLAKPVLEQELFQILGRHLEIKWIYGTP